VLFFQFTHFFNEAVVVALDDVFEVGWSIFNEQHIKNKQAQIARRIH